jgi:cyanate lyase
VRGEVAMRGVSKQQEFGDTIISAIDFELVLERLLDPEGDHWKICRTHWFLPLKYCGVTEIAQAYRHKEE